MKSNVLFIEYILGMNVLLSLIKKRISACGRDQKPEMLKAVVLLETLDQRVQKQSCVWNVTQDGAFSTWCW